MNFFKRRVKEIIEEIYTGSINVFKLPRDLYKAISGHLNAAVNKGYGSSLKYQTDEVMLKHLRENVTLFSGAKTFNFVLSTEGLIIENGKILPFKVFNSRASQLFDLHNKTWLEAEYNTAIGQAQIARDWQGYEANKEILPYLRYVTIHDAHVSDVCKACDGVIKKVGDPFWAQHSPLQHYNCRCHLESLSEAIETSGIIINNIPPPLKEFQNNPGITGQVFTKDHPYFKEIPEKYVKLAKKNFNL